MGTSTASRGITLNTTWYIAMPCGALLLALGACGCEGHSGVPGGSRGNTGQGGADQDGSAIIISGFGGGPGAGVGGHPGNPMDAAMRSGDAGPRPTPDSGDAAAPPHRNDAAPPPPHDATPPPPPPHPGDAAPPPRRDDAGP
jgi:hypothetical protein